jgi:hypothetical protein
MVIVHPVQAREPPKVKKSKIRVKPENRICQTQKKVHQFSSFTEPYQTHIVTAQMFWLLDRVLNR